VRWRNRELAAQRLSEIFERLDDITAIGIARARLDGLEEYHVDMALTEEQPQHLADD
jgi:hypothetical protein